MASHLNALTTLVFLLVFIASGMRLCVCTNFTIINDCKETIWPGITPNSNFSGGGFTLKPGQSAGGVAGYGVERVVTFNNNGNGTCQTGGCGGSIKCTGLGAPPASIAEFSLGQLDFYDVSLVDGFNLPVVVTPINGKGNCSVAGCDQDLRSTCPSELAAKSDGKTIACRSACNVFNTDEYCCRGMYSNPVTCVPTNYSSTFKASCPTAYSYAYDDPTSILTCSTSDYVVTFCGSRNRTECSYHDQKLVCSSNGLKAQPHVADMLYREVKD
ncbi:hypothetical protein RJ639_016574 [Escallonia herrerae]|uniref:Thaumatin-like protein n=1 Tax=Escallonia herrerae TaxID=1293975 RepID=A0AA89ANG3_9ASTE|nr:hypothetical protein RJ639_016574 [Escallonia herrerae]